MSAIACCYEGCGASVCFSPEVEQRLRSTHEFWCCPFGHSQHFTKETPKDLEIRLTRQSRDMWRVYYEEANEEFGSCPFCDWQSHSGTERRWTSMLRHFANAHDITGPDEADPVWMREQRRRERRLRVVS